MKSIKHLSLNYYLAIFVVIVVSSCGGQDDEKSVSEYEDVKFTANEFIENIFYKNFKQAELFCDNISKGSVRKLENFQFEFRNIYFNRIDTCEITKNAATCVCMYEDYDAKEYEQVLELIKYNGEWLVNFVLDETFDNIFLYEYETDFFEEDKKWSHEVLQMESRDYLKQLLSQFNSNDLVLGHTTSFDLKELDENLKNNSSFLMESNVEFNLLKFYNAYVFDDGTVDEVSIAISSSLDEDMDNYYKDIVDILSSELGTPYNLKSLSKGDYHQAKNIRWFIKGFNEVLEVAYINQRVVISMKAVV